MVRLTISENEHKKRIEHVRKTLAKRKLDALYLTSGVSFFYLIGYSYIATERPAALIIPANGEITFMGPLLEIDHIPLKTRLIKNIKTYPDYPGKKHPIDHFAQFLKDMGLANKQIGTDNMAGAAGIWGYTGPPITKKLQKAKFVLTKDIIQNMRLIKSEEEIELIRESAKWANLAHSLLQEYTAPSLWDFDVAIAASHEASMIMKKALGPHYEPQRWGRLPVSAGFRGQVGEMAAIPHGDPAMFAVFRQAMEIWLRELPDIPLACFYHRNPVNHTFWTGWPTEDDPYTNDAFWHKTFFLTILRLEPTQ